MAENLLDSYLDIAREQVTIPEPELWQLVASRRGRDILETELQAIEQELMEDPGCPLTMLHPDVVVHIPAITDGIVLTHRLSAAERAEGYLVLDTDLAGLLRCPDPRVASGPLEVDDYDGPVSWGGPAGWLADFPTDTLLAVRAKDGEVTISALDAEPTASPELVATLRAAYDTEVAEPQLPLSAEDLVVATLHRDRSAFAEPRLPLTELAAAAGLEQRGTEFAHAESIWEVAAFADRFHILQRELGPEGAVTALDVLEQLTEHADDRTALRDALGRLSDPAIVVAVTDELLVLDDEPRNVADVVELGERLLAAAGSTPRAAAAGWIAAIAAERGGRVLDAESHLRAAVRVSDGWPLVADRLAWYESDRGNAAEAAAIWRGLGTHEGNPELAVVNLHAALAGPEPGRNEPCWCGSGRKFKQCHQGKPLLSPLHERSGWLYRKSLSYLERRGGSVDAAWEECGAAYAGADGEVGTAMTYPIVADVLLHEYGLFEQFLADRGPLLPADEAQLAVSWKLADRGVYEVLEVGADDVAMRDLRTGKRLEITDPRSIGSNGAGAVLLARPLPDGAGLRVVAPVPLPDGAVDTALELLDGEAGPELLVWLGATAPMRR